MTQSLLIVGHRDIIEPISAMGPVLFAIVATALIGGVSCGWRDVASECYFPLFYLKTTQVNVPTLDLVRHFYMQFFSLATHTVFPKFYLPPKNG